MEEWRASGCVIKEISVQALNRFYTRANAETDGLSAFYGKEHKVIERAEAQDLADTLAGSDMAILRGDDPSRPALAEPESKGELRV